MSMEESKKSKMANNNDSCKDDKSQDLRIVYKITHALKMFVKIDSLYGWYSLKSLCTDESVDRSRSVELYGDHHLRLCIFMSVDDLLHNLLHSEAIFIPLKRSIGGGFTTRKIANPFYGFSKEEAAIKLDLLG